MRVRFKAARAPYRRGGLVFTSTRDWLVLDELTGGGLTLDQAAALAGDAAISIEIETADGEAGELKWSPVAQSDRETILSVARAVASGGEALQPGSVDHAEVFDGIRLAENAADLEAQRQAEREEAAAIERMRKAAAKPPKPTKAADAAKPAKPPKPPKPKPAGQ